MTLAKRKLTVTLLKSATSKEPERVFKLEGLRVEARIENPGGFQAWGRLHANIFGVKPETMNTFTMIVGRPLTQSMNQIIVEAGDDDGMFRVFDGNITFSAQNLQGAPDVCLVVEAIAGMSERIAPAAPNSYKGSFDVATAIKGIAERLGYTFENNGVTAKLRDHYAAGSAIDQIYDLARAAGIMCSIENRIVAIWPNGKPRNERVVKVSKSTGLVGYPLISNTGTAVRTVFNPSIVLGTRIDLESAITPVNGRWSVQTTTHDLASLVPDGPWYTAVTLTPYDIFVPKN